MKKVLYHGSYKLFNEFVIDKDLARHSLDVLVEGYGIYMVEAKEFAETYGDNVYVVEVEDADIFDSISKKELRSIIQKVGKKVKVDILNSLDFDMLYNGVYSGNLSVHKLYKEISDMLESQEWFYEKYSSRITLDDDCLFEEIKKTYIEALPNVIKYFDWSFKRIIYVCKKNPECLHIVNTLSN